ncbi:hypothetical protein HMPREF1544_08385 [Mucor circinelloides 1006PhL]|uniref:Uncharacterized protein n=1 Tax=Mucor circinelloides f. circinelloides (strain 1006PhL) TaxID=1220926 RepID=S2JQM8_MUCC1|nr:hypothetical protein HMPREF1544_08385 [Mucor circinelloides 1006PhL]
MASRKRSRDQVEKDEAHQDPHLLTKFQIVHGLNTTWNNNPTPEAFNALIDQLHDINSVYVTEHIRKRKEKINKALRKSNKLTSLQNIAELEQEGYDSVTLKLPHFDHHPIVMGEGSSFTSAIQHRYQQFKKMGSPTGLKCLSKDVRTYYLYQAMQEHEAEHGPMDEDYALSMVGNSCWTPTEKRKFFMAVERCSRGDVVEISRRVGPTKTIAEVGAYLNLLDGAAKAIGGYEPDEKYTAREMSDLFLMQETRMALILEAKLETETYAKDQELMKQESIQKSLELFEIWNFSSITRIFAEINDMTVLSSSLVQYYQLIKKFVLDILTAVYTELLDSENKTVTRSVMNHVIAKRKVTWTDMNNKKDVRLSNLDILSMIDRRYKYHKLFSEYRSASFLAKKRRMAWQKADSEQENDDEQEENVIEIDSDDSDRENSSDMYDSDDDDMLKPFDQEDELKGWYVGQDDGKQHYFESLHQKLYENIDIADVGEGGLDGEDWEDVNSEKEDSKDECNVAAQERLAIEQDVEVKEERDEKDEKDQVDEFPGGDSEDEYEDVVEERMQQLDYMHEQELVKHLGFVDADTILARQPIRRW